MSLKGKIYGITKGQRRIRVYDYDDQEGNVIVYDGKTIFRMEKQKFYADKKDYFHSINRYIKCDKNKSIKKTYDDFVQAAYKLKEESKGLINLFKTGSIPATALALFDHFTTVEPEPIGEEEG